MLDIPVPDISVPKTNAQTDTIVSDISAQQRQIL